MTSATLTTQLPWSSSDQENRRFNRITTVALVVTLVLAGVVKLQTLPDIPRAEKEKLPPQLTRLVRPTPPPAPPKAEPKPVEPKSVETPKVEPKVKPVAKPPVETKSKPPAETAKPKVQEQKVQPVQTVEQARKAASQSGLLALKDELQSLRQQTSRTAPVNTPTVEGSGQSAQTQRKTLSSAAVAQTSGGVKSGEVSTNIGTRGALDQRQTTEFTAPTEGAASLAAKQVETDSTVTGSRDLESIRKVLDANMGAVHALYRRALRQSPELQGKVTFKLTIEPDGHISQINIVHSELYQPDLEAKLMARVAMINFGAEAVTQTQLEYGFNFLPY